MSRGFTIAAVVVLTALAAGRADAQVGYGAQASLGTEGGLGLGARLIFPLIVSPLGMDGTLDANYFFGGGDAIDNWIETNANVRLPIPLSREFETRVGTGVNATFLTFDLPEDSDTEAEIGINLIGSLSLPQHALAPYAELRAVLGGAEQVVITAGISVGGRRSTN